MTEKIFGIGLSRTGTTSLATALEMLGYRAIHAECLQDIEFFEASTDTPVTARYKELDQRYPGSRFILTVRDIDSWLRSCQNHWYDLDELVDPVLKAEFLFCRRKLYGIDHYDADVFRDAYLRHMEDVREYFKDRPNDLLEINIIAGEGFEKLCPFLGKPMVDAELPRLNVARTPDTQAEDKGSYTIVSGHLTEAVRAFSENEIELGQLHFRTAAAVVSQGSDNDFQPFLHLVVYTGYALRPDDPEGFINFVFDHLPEEAATFSALKRQAFGYFHTVALFRALQENKLRAAGRHLLPALRQDPSLVLNRGLIKGILVSLVRGPGSERTA